MYMSKAGYSAGYYTSKMILDENKLNEMKLNLYDIYENNSEYISGFEKACIECHRQAENNGSRFGKER